MRLGEKETTAVRAGLMGVAAVLALGCGGSDQRGTSRDARLNGEWEIALTVFPGSFAHEGDTGTVRGTLAFVPNDAGTRVPSFGGIPEQVGTHNLRLARVLRELSTSTTAPMAAAISSGDSVRMVLDPESGEPVVLRGTWQGPAVAGQWSVHHRAGIDQEGRFSLRRPLPQASPP